MLETASSPKPHKDQGNSNNWETMKENYNRTSLCSASTFGCQQDTARICCSAVAAVCRRVLSPAGGALSSKLACTLLLLSIDGTDRRTDARPFHKSCSAYYAGSVKNEDSLYRSFYEPRWD